MNQISSSFSSSTAMGAGFCNGLVSQLDALGWHKLQFMSEDLSQLHLQLCDSAGRQHLLKLQLPPSFPLTPPTVTIDLPEPVAPAWGPHYTLSQLVNHMDMLLDKYQALWDALQDIDEHCIVLEPTGVVSYSCCYRRIALGGHASVLMTLLPHAANALPNCTLLGAGTAVGHQLQQRWFADSARLWDDRKLPRNNLEAILQLTLPRQHAAASQSQMDDDVVSADCAICYAYHLPDCNRPNEPGDVPTVTCSAPNCNRPFHKQCLVEWLQSLTNSSRCFDTLFGECPYCSKTVSVRLSD
eukprot:jgi/Chrzof1/10719/Cz05g09280.t1